MKRLLEQKAKLSTQRDRILNERSLINATLNADQTALEDVQKALTLLDAEYNRIQSVVERIQKETADISAKQAGEETQLSMLKARKEELEKEISNLSGFAFGKKRELRNLLEQNATAIASAENNCLALKKQIVVLEADPVFSERQSLLTKIHTLDGQCQNLQQSVSQYQSKAEQAQAELLQIEEELTAVNLSIEALRQKEIELAVQKAAEKASCITPLAETPTAKQGPDPKPSSIHPVFRKLEALFPEHKVFALDSIDSTLREQLASMYQSQGYRTVEELLSAHGFSLISGDEVKKIRSFVLYTPGNEPDIIRPKVESMLRLLEQYYPNKTIPRGIQQDHKSLSQTISGLYQWLGYSDIGSMLEAYGFRYLVGSSGRPENDYDAVIDALIAKYRNLPKPKNMGILLYDNPEFKSSLKTLQNKAPELFGMSLKKYFEELGLFEEKNSVSTSHAPAKTGSGTMQDAAFAALSDLYVQLDPAVYGSFQDACQQLSSYTVKKNKAGQLYIFRALSAPKQVTIPYGINFISDDAFAGQTAIETLVFPSTLEKIGNNAFSGCANLKSIQFAEGLTTIGNRAFEDCCKVANISIPRSVDTIGTYAFRNCSSLTNVTFGNPAGVYDDHVFEGCPWKPDDPTELNLDVDHFLYETDRKNLVTITGYTGTASILQIPQKLGGKPVVAIGKSAFEGNDYLREVSMPDTVSSLQNYAFRDCEKLEKVMLSNSISRLYASTFSGCRSLKSINLPDQLSELKRGTLKDAPLTSLHIGKSLQQIHPSLFYHGEYDAFTGELISCRSINHITVDPDNAYLSADGCCVFSADGSKLYAALGNLQNYEVPQGVVKISSGAFERLTCLTDVTFPETLEVIGESAFSQTALRRIHFGSGMRSIEDSAFAYCQKLSSAVFDTGIESIGKFAFAGCPLAAVSLPASVRSLGSECFPCFSAYDQHMRDFRIAEDNPWLKADGSALYQISEDAVTLCAFYGHTYRQQVFSLWNNQPDSPAYLVAEGTTVIGQGAFRNCPNIGEVILPYGLLRIEDHAFDGCTNLKTINIPETVTQIGAYAFFGCNISSIEIPASVREIQDGAFSMGYEWDEADSSLTQIHIAQEHPLFCVINNSLFRRRNGLELIAYFGKDALITIPESTTRIGACAFYKTSISEVSIPASVQSIGEKAFHRCHHLKRLIIGLSAPQNKIKQATIYIPEPTANIFGLQDLSERDQFMDCIRIDGSGVLFDFVKYDGLFDTISKQKDRILVATDRLKSAVELIPHYRNRYLSYLQSHAESAVKIVITDDDLEGLNTLAELGVFTGNNISQVIDLATAAGKADIASYLMNYKHTAIGFTEFDWEL